MTISTNHADHSTNALKPKRLLRLPEVIRRCGLPCASIYEQMALGVFPKPVALSVRSRAWVESEIDEWIEARIRERTAD